MITREEFEKRYAEKSGETVDWLHKHGEYAVPCSCGLSDCPSWRMINVFEKYHICPDDFDSGQSYLDLTLNQGNSAKLDGDYTAAELRRIADALDEIKSVREIHVKICSMCKQSKLTVRMCTDHPLYHDGEYCEDCVSSDSWN